MIARLKQLLRVGVVSNEGADSDTIPVQQLSYHGKKGNSLAWLPYGFHSIAINDSLCLILAANANSEERMHIATSMLDRPQGAPGEVFVFHPQTGTRIHLKNNGDVDIISTNDVNVTAEGDINATATDVNVTASGDITAIAGGDINATATGNLITTSAGLEMNIATEELIDIIHLLATKITGMNIEHSGAWGVTAAFQSTMEAIEARILAMKP